MLAVRVVVTGRVQGVGFRAFVLREASSRRLGGWVRNRADGAVETEAQGTAEALRAFVEALRRGPHPARVEDVSEQWFESPSAVHGFRVVG